MPTPPAAMASWNCTSRLEAVPPLALPSLVADLMKRLRRVSGPMRSGVKARFSLACISIMWLSFRAASGGARLGGGTTHRGDFRGAVVVLERLYGNGGLHVPHARQRQDAVVGDLDDVLECCEQADRENVEPAQHEDDAA